MKLTKGVLLIANGGWEAIVIWVRADRQGFYAVHRHGMLGGQIGIQGVHDESNPVYHWPDGTAHADFSLNEPPAYNGHPADLDMDGYEL